MTSDEQRLREALHNAPSTPTRSGVGAEIARQGRRRRRGRSIAAGAGGAAVVIAVAVGGLALRGPSDRSPVTDRSPTPTESTPTTPPGELSCTRPAAASVEGAPVVPDGAVAARLCGGQVDNGGFDMSWPADTLRGEYVARLVARLNGLSPYVQPDVCTTPGSPPFDLVLEYADGARVWAHGDTAGSCEHLTVDGGGRWRGSPGVLVAARRLIEEQRAEVGPARSAPAAATCPGSWNDVAYTDGASVLGPGSEVAVTACRYRLEKGDPATITQSWAGTLQHEAIVDDPQTVLRLVAAGSRADPCHGSSYDLDRTQDVLLVRDRYGDIHLVSTTPCWPNSLTGRRLYPSAELAGLVAGILDQPG